MLIENKKNFADIIIHFILIIRAFFFLHHYEILYRANQDLIKLINNKPLKMCH